MAVPAVSVMLAVPDAPSAADWYRRALGATELWNLGSVIGLELQGAPFFLGEPAGNGWESPGRVGTTTCRIEVFVDDPDGFVARAVEAGADGDQDRVRDHEVPWGVHRQGGFFDPFGHLWLVGDRSPLKRHPEPAGSESSRHPEPAGPESSRHPEPAGPGSSRPGGDPGAGRVA